MKFQCWTPWTTELVIRIPKTGSNFLTKWILADLSRRRLFLFSSYLYRYIFCRIRHCFSTLCLYLDGNVIQQQQQQQTPLPTTFCQGAAMLQLVWIHYFKNKNPWDRNETFMCRCWHKFCTCLLPCSVPTFHFTNLYNTCTVTGLIPRK